MPRRKSAKFSRAPDGKLIPYDPALDPSAGATRDDKGRVVAGGRGLNPTGKRRMTEMMKKLKRDTGDEAMRQLHRIITDKTAFGKDGWLGQKEQFTALEMAISRAYGKPVQPRDATRDEGRANDGRLTPEGFEGILKSVYESVNLPEYQQGGSRQPKDIVDVTPIEDGEEEAANDVLG